MKAPRFAFLTVLLAILTSSCGGGGDGEGDGPSGLGLADLNMDGRIVVMAFGDSITRGTGDGPTGTFQPRGPAGYPARLEPLLIAANRTTVPVFVINSGRPGEHTPNAVRRLPRELAANNPDYVILLDGANDLELGRVQTAATNIQTMMNLVVQAGAQPILATLTPSCCNHVNLLPIGAIWALNIRIRDMAFTNMVPLIDFFVSFTGGNEEPGGTELPYDRAFGLISDPEGLHPNPAGYDLMAAVALALFTGDDPPIATLPPPVPPPIS